MPSVRRPTRLREPLIGPTNYVYHVIFSPDGQLLAAGSADGTVHLWNMTNRYEPKILGKPLTGPKGFVCSVAFTPNGHTLAAASGDKTVWLWDVTNPRRPEVLATLTGPTEAVFSAAFSPDGRTLAASGQDKTVRLWNTNPGDVAVYVCSIAGDPITEEEWNRYIPGLPYDPPARGDAPRRQAGPRRRTTCHDAEVGSLTGGPVVQRALVLRGQMTLRGRPS